MLLPHFFVADMELQPLGVTKHIQTCFFNITGEDVRFVHEMHEILYDVISSQSLFILKSYHFCLFD